MAQTVIASARMALVAPVSLSKITSTEKRVPYSSLSTVARSASVPTIKSRTGYLGSPAKLMSSLQKSTVLALRRRPLVVEAARKVQSDRSVIFNMTLEANEGESETVRKLCLDFQTWVKNGPMKDPNNGILAFEGAKDSVDEGVYHFLERYRTSTHLNIVKGKTYKTEFENFMQQVRVHLKGPMQMTLYEYSNGQIGYIRNPVGPRGEGGLDDAPGGSGGSGGGASLQQSSSAVADGIHDEPVPEVGIPEINYMNRMNALTIEKKNEHSFYYRSSEDYNREMDFLREEYAEEMSAEMEKVEKDLDETARLAKSA